MVRRLFWGAWLLVCGTAEFVLAGSYLWRESGRRLPPGLDIPLDWLEVLGLHAALVVTAAFCVRLMRPGDLGRSLALISLVMGLFFPGLGVISMAFIVMLQPGMARRAGLVDEFKHNISIKSEREEQKVQVKDVVEYLADQVNVAPLADLVQSEEPSLRRGAIAALAKIKNPTAVRLLKEARGDPSPEMRVHAHVALTRLDNEMSDNLSKAIKAAELAPDDTDALEAQAQAAMDYLLSGLLEEAAMDHYVGLATEPLNRILAREPQHPEALLMYGRLLLIGHNPLAARRTYETYLKSHGPHEDAFLGMCEALYLLDEYHIIPRAAAGFRRQASRTTPDRQAMAATELWIS